MSTTEKAGRVAPAARAGQSAPADQPATQAEKPADTPRDGTKKTS